MAVRAPQSNHRLLYSPAATIWSHLMFCRAVGSWTLKVVLGFGQLTSVSRWAVGPCCDTPLFCHLLTVLYALTSLVGLYEKHASVNTKITLLPNVYLLLWNYMCSHWVTGACWSKTFRWHELYFNASIKESLTVRCTFNEAKDFYCLHVLSLEVSMQIKQVWVAFISMGTRQILLCWWNLYFLLPCRLVFCLPPPMISLYRLNQTESHVMENKECMQIFLYITIAHIPKNIKFWVNVFISHYSILCWLAKAYSTCGHINMLL